jgi:hypothetical protein
MPVFVIRTLLSGASAGIGTHRVPFREATSLYRPLDEAPRSVLHAALDLSNAA